MSGEIIKEEKEIILSKDTKIILTPAESEKIVCEVCGCENDASRTLCRVCSNYLEKTNSIKEKGDNENG